MNNFKRDFYGIGTTTAAGKINYLRTLLHGGVLQDFDGLSIQNAVTNSIHQIHPRGFNPILFLINEVSKQKRLMRRAMHKP